LTTGVTDFDNIDSLLASANEANSDDDSDLESGDPSESQTILINGKEYVEVKNVAKPIRKAGGGKRTSSVWKLGVELQRVDDGVRFFTRRVDFTSRRRLRLLKNDVCISHFATVA
jgi:hypothetical protein